MAEGDVTQGEAYIGPRSHRLMLLDGLVRNALTPDLLNQGIAEATPPSSTHSLSSIAERTASIVAGDRLDISQTDVGTRDESPGKLFETIAAYRKQGSENDPENLTEYTEYGDNASRVARVERRAKILNQADGLLAAHRSRFGRTKAFAEGLPDGSELKAHIGGIVQKLEEIDDRKLGQPAQYSAYDWSNAEREIRELEFEQLRDLASLTVDFYLGDMAATKNAVVDRWGLVEGDDSIIATALRTSLGIPQNDTELAQASQYRAILDQIEDRYSVARNGHYTYRHPIIPITPEEAIAAKQAIVERHIEYHNRGGRKLTGQDHPYPPEALQSFFDISYNYYIGALRQGGRESDDGSYAASAIGYMRDPRALPDLLRYFRESGPGHTSAVAVSAFERIVQDPSSPEAMEQVVAGLPKVDQMMIQLILDHDSLFRKMSAPGMYTYSWVSSLADSGKTVTRELVLQYAHERYGDILTDEDFLSFMANWDDEVITPTVLQDPESLGKVILGSGLSNWRMVQPVIMHRLTNPEDGNNQRFPLLIAKEGLELNDDPLTEKLATMYQHKDLSRSVTSRAAMVDGLLVLSTKGQAGQDTARLLLSVAEPTQNDSERFRKIMGLLNQLELMDSFPIPSGTNLREIHASLRTATANAAVEKLQIDPKLRQVVEDNLDSLIGSGLLEIAPHLAATYEAKSAEQAKSVLRESVEHIIRGDFHEWRAQHSAAKGQLEFIPESDHHNWTEKAEDTLISMRSIDADSQSDNLATSVIRVVEEARAHLLEDVDFEVDHETLERMRIESASLTTALKSADTPPDDRPNLGRKRTTVVAQIKLIEGIMHLTSDRLNVRDLTEMQRKVEEMRKSATVLGLEQVVLDLGEAIKVLSSEDLSLGSSTLRVSDTDDPLSLLKSGIEPRETCQSWRGGKYNECLPATVADVDKRLVNVTNDHNEVVGRAIIKGRRYRDSDDHTGDMKPVILVEPVYTLHDQPQIHEGIIRHTLKKAAAINADVAISIDKRILEQTGASNDETVQVLRGLIQDMGYEASEMTISISIPPSYNAYEYSDSLGGKITHFGQQQSISTIILRRKTD